MDLTSLGLDVSTIAGIIGVCIAIRLWAIGINKINKKNKFTQFLDKYILLVVVVFGIIAGIGLGIKDFTKSIQNNISIIIKNSFAYAGGSVLFHQLYKQFFEKKDESKNIDVIDKIG